MVLVPPIAIQLFTPNRMRAQTTTSFLLVVNIIAMGLGPTLVAVFAYHVFGAPNMLNRSLISLAVIFCPITALVVNLGSGPFRKGMANAN